MHKVLGQHYRPGKRSEFENLGSLVNRASRCPFTVKEFLVDASSQRRSFNDFHFLIFAFKTIINLASVPFFRLNLF